MEIICVMLGGALGSTARYLLGKRFAARYKSIPIGTFVINVSGAFLLGFVTGADISQLLYGLFAEGFLGAYTTFSTFMYEDFVLLQNNRILSAIIYISTTVVLGFIACYLGTSFAVFIIAPH
ncbi:fluoride efflux transporter CrcB [Acetobacterium paludosum]|uniref:Fluoride-specific ion channel FluC n=1 Tax=Acetobacterium paludosum TaxID=52693 RepID=A0A923KQD2_9FIRM|nr:fluoride efflux transporter CrcB [Acetobacterium paludosum]MBC3889024.1 fluoride efflux transporter CrcB [Acetobacterium paludosum]